MLIVHCPNFSHPNPQPISCCSINSLPADNLRSALTEAFLPTTPLILEHHIPEVMHLNGEGKYKFPDRRNYPPKRLCGFLLNDKEHV